jgi:hypothetical protein
MCMKCETNRMIIKLLAFRQVIRNVDCIHHALNNDRLDYVSLMREAHIGTTSSLTLSCLISFLSSSLIVHFMQGCIALLNLLMPACSMVIE